MLLFLDSNGTTQLKRAPCPLSSNSVRSRVRFNGVLLRDALEASLSQESSYGNLYNTASRSWHVWMIDTFTASLFGKMCFGWEKKGGILQTLVSGNVPASRKLMKRFFGARCGCHCGRGRIERGKGLALYSIVRILDKVALDVQNGHILVVNCSIVVKS